MTVLQPPAHFGRILLPTFTGPTGASLDYIYIRLKTEPKRLREGREAKRINENEKNRNKKQDGYRTKAEKIPGSNQSFLRIPSLASPTFVFLK